jgi:ketosteroid isomerase-like protein
MRAILDRALPAALAAVKMGRVGNAHNDLREANAAFYRALEELDIEAMDRIWLHETWVRCIHPGWDVLVGWPAVRESWENVFASTKWIRVASTGVDVQVFGEIGIVFSTENITAPRDDDVAVAVAQATNLFLARSGGWKMIHHHASPAPVRVTQPFSGIIQ